MLRRLVQRIEGTMFREMSFRADGIIDEDKRTLQVVASSETPILRRSFFASPWLETLGHKRGEVNLERLKSSAPVLYNHNMWSRADRVGVVESAKLNTKDRQVEAVIRISKRDDVSDLWTDIVDGVLRNISMGYTVDERVLTREGVGEPDEFRITSWSPGEISLVPLGADIKGKIGRSLGDAMEYRIFDIVNERSTTDMFRYDNDGNPLPDTPEVRAAILAGTATRSDGSPYVPTDEVRAAIQVQSMPPVVTPPPVATVTNITEADTDAAREAGILEGRQAEQTRVADINALFVPFSGEHDEVRTAAIAKADQTVEQTRALLLTALGANLSPAGGDAHRIEGGEDAKDKFIRAGCIAIAVRAGIATDDERIEVGKTGFRGYTLYEMARRSLEIAGVSTDRFGKMELAGRAFTTSDFPLLLQDAANKSLLRGWDESPESWQVWCLVGELADFKIGNRVNLSSFNDLTLVNEDGEYTYGSFQDEGETIQLATYGKLFAISRQSIINDDLGAFTRIPAAMGRAAGRVVGDLAYGVLTANALLADGLALFSGGVIGTDHGNLSIGGAAAISVASVDAARVAMARQTDGSSSATALNIRPSFLLVPVGLEGVARVLMANEFDPGEGVTTSFRRANSVRGLAKVVSDARLDVNDANGWYLAAKGDTVEVAFLDGNSTPMLEQQAGWTIDGTEFKVRLDVAAAALDYRGLQSNIGA